jgi:hypothetical protein
MAWIRITDEKPGETERVWGFDAFYGGQGECKMDRGWLVWANGHDDCHITHWKRAVEEPPSDEELEAVRRIEERRDETVALRAEIQKLKEEIERLKGVNQ